MPPSRTARSVDCKGHLHEGRPLCCSLLWGRHRQLGCLCLHHAACSGSSLLPRLLCPSLGSSHLTCPRCPASWQGSRLLLLCWTLRCAPSLLCQAWSSPPGLMQMGLSQVQLMQQVAEAWGLGLPIQGSTACSRGPCPLVSLLQPSAVQLLRWARAAAGWQLTLEPSFCAQPGRRELHAAAVEQHWHSLAAVCQHGDVQWGITSVLRPRHAAQRHLPQLQPSRRLHLTCQVSLQSESQDVSECTMLTMT